MVSKKSSRRPVSRISSAASPAVSAATQTVQKSSVLRSAFSPSKFQLALFASVIQGLDSQHLRIHDINSGRLQCEHAINSKANINSLDWGYYSKAREHHSPQSKRKRKRQQDVNGLTEEEDGQAFVVAFGTSESNVQMYCPAEDKIVGTLSGGHDRGVRDFKFTDQKPTVDGWSIGGDGKLVQWDLRNGRSLRSISLPSTSVSTLARPVPSNAPILCASQTPYLINIESEGQDSVTSFNALKIPVHTLISSPGTSSGLSESFLAAGADRYMTVFDVQKQKLIGSLIAESDVDTLAFHPSPIVDARVQDDSEVVSATTKKQILAAVTQDGVVEIFSKPFYYFHESQSSNTTSSLKAQRKKMARKADALIKIIRPDQTGTVVPVFNAEFYGPDLLVAWADGGVNLNFERIRWQDEDTEDLILQGRKEVVRSKAASALGSAVMNGVKDLGKSHVDESRAVVVDGDMAEDVQMGNAPQDAISISSDQGEGESSSEGDGSSEEEAGEQKTPAVVEKDVERDEVNDQESEAEDGGEPSFGELVQANASDPVDVVAALEDSNAAALVSTEATSALQIPSGVSLATVLSQSLRTNDLNLLESCFHTTDVDIVRATIQRLDSSLASTLLQKLAQRLSRRPGRYGHLLVWVQWVCVAHGGAIAGRPDVLKKVTSLFRVMDQRSGSLSSLLLLKGKLDMLHAQMGLRRSMQASAPMMDSDDEENVIYVEGQEEEESEGNQDKMDEGFSAIRGKKGRPSLEPEESAEEDDDEMPLVNGVASESDNEEESGDGDLIDDEAEVSDDDSSDEAQEESSEEEVDEDENDLEDFIVDESEENSDAAGGSLSPPPSKKSKVQDKRNGILARK